MPQTEMHISVVLPSIFETPHIQVKSIYKSYKDLLNFKTVSSDGLSNDFFTNFRNS